MQTWNAASVGKRESFTFHSDMSKIILDLCGGTGAWSKPYKDAGYDVRLVTLPHHDVRTYTPPKSVHGILAAPPCTEFAVSGARWWKYKDPQLLADALDVVDACLDIIRDCQPSFWSLENPVGRLKRLRWDRLGEPALSFNPCDYGDPYTKKTLLWGDFNALEKSPVAPVFVTYSNGKRFAPNYGWSSNKSRGVTPSGFARAFFKANP